MMVSRDSVTPCRQAFTVESGLNDGLAVLVLLLALAWAGLQDAGGSSFAAMLVEVLGIGALVGIGAGLLVDVALVATTRRWGNSRTWSSMIPRTPCAITDFPALVVYGTSHAVPY
jgi:NhaP-type Na+/H+ or K+/H+ antiporter